MLVIFTQPAADGERLAPGCLDSAVGREYPLDIEGLPPSPGVITSATALPGGESVELTLDIADDSPAARALLVLGRGPGPFGIHPDGTLYRPVEIRRRDPEDAARLIREGYRERGIPEGLAEALIAEPREP